MNIHLSDWFHVDFSRTQWEMLWKPWKFYWEEDVTPFSSRGLQVWALLIYFAAIIVLWTAMKNKNPMKWAKDFSVYHNLFLFFLSIAMAAGTLSLRIYHWISDGFGVWICETNPHRIVGWFGYWCYIYHLSKYYELLDTLIIVLRKNNLTFLHLWHHSCMVPITRLWIHIQHPTQWWSVFLNSFVHIFMYWYYCQSARGKHVWWKKYLTQLQLVQFVMFLLATIAHSFYYEKISIDFESWQWNATHNCVGRKWPLYLSIAFNVSLILLFSDFYSKAYKGGESESKPTPRTPRSNGIANGMTNGVKPNGVP
jgi:fatty acid elongase 3